MSRKLFCQFSYFFPYCNHLHNMRMLKIIRDSRSKLGFIYFIYLEQLSNTVWINIKKSILWLKMISFSFQNWQPELFSLLYFIILPFMENSFLLPHVKLLVLIPDDILPFFRRDILHNIASSQEKSANHSEISRH